MLQRQGDVFASDCLSAPSTIPLYFCGLNTIEDEKSTPTDRCG
jgi:hypothetical protein